MVHIAAISALCVAMALAGCGGSAVLHVGTIGGASSAVPLRQAESREDCEMHCGMLYDRATPGYQDCLFSCAKDHPQ